MTHDPDQPERDPALDAAWREHSTEMPPSRLDAAILAAAHRAAGSGPQPIAAHENGKRPDDSGPTTRAATGPQRWWMPLAAAATIGAIALGILQTMPQHESVIAPPVSDMPARAVERTPAVPEASRDAVLLKEKSDAAGAVVEADAARTPAVAAPSATSLAAARKQSAKPAAPQATDRIAPSSASLAEAPQPSPASIATAPPPSSAPVAAAPQPFPAEKKAESGQSAESVDLKNRARAASATKPAGAPSVAQFSDVARKDERQHSEPQSPSAAAGSMALGKTAANSAVPARAIDVDASVVRIRKLHDEGRLADAAKELLALRQAIPDADGRLPPELRAWAATVKQ